MIKEFGTKTLCCCVIRESGSGENSFGLDYEDQLGAGSGSRTCKGS